MKICSICFNHMIWKCLTWKFVYATLQYVPRPKEERDSRCSATESQPALEDRARDTKRPSGGCEHGYPQSNQIVFLELIMGKSSFLKLYIENSMYLFGDVLLTSLPSGIDCIGGEVYCNVYCWPERYFTSQMYKQNKGRKDNRSLWLNWLHTHRHAHMHTRTHMHTHICCWSLAYG